MIRGSMLRRIEEDYNHRHVQIKQEHSGNGRMKTRYPPKVVGYR